MANLLSTNVSGRLYTSGHVDTNTTQAAFRFYDSSTFRGGLGLDDWAHGGSAANITMYVNGDNNFFISTSGTRRAQFNSSAATFRTYSADTNYNIRVTGGDQFNAYYGDNATTMYVNWNGGTTRFGGEGRFNSSLYSSGYVWAENASIRVGEIWGQGGLYRSSGHMMFGTEGGNWYFQSQNNTRAYFASGDGNLWMQWGGWLSDLLSAKQNASTAITTSNIGSQSVASASQVSGVSVSATEMNRLKTTLGVTGLPYSCDIVVEGDPNTYYPVHFIWGDQDVWRRIIIKRGYGEEAPWDPIGTGVHHGGLLLDWEGNFGGWGGADYSDRLRVFQESYTNICADMYRTTHSMGYTFFLRGGGAVYHIFSDQSIRGYHQDGVPDIAYDTNFLFYDHSITEYRVYAPAPVTSINSSRIDGLRTKKQSQFDGRYQQSDTAINTGNIGSQSVSYATNSGNSATTSQRSFDYIYGTSYLESAGAVYGTIFYDNNDRTYYVDPNSYSRIYRTSTHIAPSPGVGSSNWVNDFNATPTSSMSFGGDLSSGGPQGTWWFQQNFRHSNSSNYWGTQVAWGWEDNANELWQRNVQGGNWSGWVRYINTNNYTGILDLRYQQSSTAITTSNIGSQSVSYASSAGNADTVDSLHASDFVRAYGTTNDNIDSDWGQSFKTFDPVPGGTPPIASPNLRTINVGNDFNRRTQLAFTYATDQAWFRRRDSSGWQSWREFIHSGNIASQSVSYADESGYSASSGSVEWTSVQNKPDTFPPSSHTHDYLSDNGDSEQLVGLRYASWNAGPGRMNTDPRWNESGYDADLGCLHIWAWTAAGVAYGRAGIALYNGSAYQYLTTRGGTSGMFVNNQEIIHAGNIGSQSVNYAASAGTADNIDGVGFRNTGSNSGTNADTIDSNGITYYTDGVSNFSGNSSDGALYSQRYSTSWQHQIAGDYRSGMIAVRGRNNGTWTSWKTIIDSSTIGSQSVNYATSAGNADTVDSLHASSFVRNDATGQYLRAYYQYGSYLTSERPIDLRNQMGGSGMRVDFMNGGGGGNWNHVITFSGYDAYNMYQLGGYYDGGSSTNLYVRSEANHGTTSWTAWRRLLNEVADPYAVNMNQYVRTTDGPTFAEVYSSGWFRNYGNQGIYNQSYGTHFYSNGGSDWSITGNGTNIYLALRSNHQSTIRGYVHANTDNYIGFLSEDGNWVLRTWNRGVEAYGSMRAPIFYDSNDTNYYLDPAGTSRLGGLMLEANLETGRGSYGADKANLVLLASSTYGRAAIDFRSGVNYPSDGAQIYYETATNLSSGETSRLVIRTENDADDSILIRGGFIELNTTTVDGGSSSPGVRTQYNGNNRLLTYSDHTAETSSFNAPQFLVNNHSDNTRGYRIHNTSSSSVSAMFVNSANALVIAAGAVDQVNLNKKVLVNGVALGVNVSPSGTAGRIDASNDIVAYSSSDERLKHNIAPIENALDKVKSLTGVEFDWKPEYKHAHGYEGHDTGIIAQQVQDVMPSAVRTNDTGFLAVRYEKLIGLLIEGMKEQQAQIDELKAKLDGLTK